MRDGFVKAAVATPPIRVADPAANARAICACMEEAAAQGVKLLVLPELCITGYTCADLFLSAPLQTGALEALAEIVAGSAGFDMLTFVGLPVAQGGALYNCAAAVYDGSLLGLVPKTHIPNYGEFYEKRWFSPGPADCRQVHVGPFTTTLGTNQLFTHAHLADLTVACELCEDLWVPCPPSGAHALAGATVLVNLSASNELVTKDDYRRELVSGQSARLVGAYLYADAGAGESTTDLVFTGHNLICENGAILAESQGRTGLTITEIDVQRLAYERRRLGTFPGGAGAGYSVHSFGTAPVETALTRVWPRNPFVPDDTSRRAQRCEKILYLQRQGLCQRMGHAGARHAVIGVSGGLDSTLAMLVTAGAMDALGLPREHLIAVTMPCFGTTERTKSNATYLAERLGASLRTVDIGKAVEQHFADIGHDAQNHNVVYENAQARERTQVLMDIANGCGGLVVGTGDLSELALGWCTYNGDHMSMYGVNAGVPKTLVRHLVHYYADACGDAALRQVLLDILDTPVSPELLPAENGVISQKTEDLVGPYELHDFFLYYLIRWGFAPEKVRRLAVRTFHGLYDAETVEKWLRTFLRRFFAQQFKRSCLPDGPKVGTLSLSPRGDWRMPSDASCALWLAALDA